MLINCCCAFHINRSAQPVPDYRLRWGHSRLPFLKADSGPYGENPCLQNHLGSVTKNKMCPTEEQWDTL